MNRKDSCQVNLAHSRNLEQRRVLVKIIDDKVCPFCPLHLKRYHKKPILKKGKHWLVTSNQWPYKGSRHHFLIIHRGHVNSLSKISRVAAVELIKQTSWLEGKYNLHGGALLLRFGDTDLTGATVTHLHAHLIVGGRRQRNKGNLTTRIGYKK